MNATKSFIVIINNNNYKFKEILSFFHILNVYLCIKNRNIFETGTENE